MKIPLRTSTGGTVDPTVATRRSAASMDGHVELRVPSPVELVWMEELRLHLRAPDVDITSLAVVSGLFDTYSTAWHDAEEGNRWNPNHVITALGIALGDILVARSMSAHWMVAADNRITTVAVRDDLCRGTVFPVDAVARRWIAGERGWMTPFIDQTRVTLQRTMSRRVTERA